MNDHRERDMFGHPVRSGKGGRGRPSIQLTENDLDLLEAGLTKGWSNARIAKVLGIGLSTLKRNYGPLLAQRDSMSDKLELAIFATTVRKAIEKSDMGAVRQLRQILSDDAMHDAARRLREAMGDDDDDAPRPKPVGKKEAANAAAKNAGEGSEWGADLLPGVLN